MRGKCGKCGKCGESEPMNGSPRWCVRSSLRHMPDWRRTENASHTLRGTIKIHVERSGVRVSASEHIDKMRFHLPKDLRSERGGQVLSTPQCEVEELLIRGQKPAEIALLLGRNEKVVRATMARIYEKRGVHSIVELILATCDVVRKPA